MVLLLVVLILVVLIRQIVTSNDLQKMMPYLEYSILLLRLLPRKLLMLLPFSVQFFSHRSDERRCSAYQPESEVLKGGWRRY